MNLSRILTLASLAAAAYMGSGWSGDSARLVAADGIIAVAQKERDDAKRELATAEEINAANLAAFEAAKIEIARANEIAAQAKAAATKRAADLKTALKRIKNAPKSEDGPIAPVLRRELDDLRTDSVRPVGGDSDPVTDPADPDPSGAPGDQGGEPAVQPPAPTS